jgi:hypothetical protein
MRLLYLLGIERRPLDFLIFSLVAIWTDLSCYRRRIRQQVTFHFRHTRTEKEYKKLFEKVIAYFPSTVISVPGATIRNETSVFVRNEVKKQ